MEFNNNWKNNYIVHSSFLLSACPSSHAQIYLTGMGLEYMTSDRAETQVFMIGFTP